MEMESGQIWAWLRLSGLGLMCGQRGVKDDSCVLGLSHRKV